VPVISAPQDFNVDDLFVDLGTAFGRPLHLKCEGFNFAGSVKLKAASAMVAAAERAGRIGPGSTLVESSSGNLGVALGLIAANKGYRFVCVTDVRCNPVTRRLMEALGAQVHVVSDATGPDGLLGTRIRYVREMCAGNDNYVWLNQYASEANWMAHFLTTAPAVANQFAELDVLFVGAGTTGTLMGCARYFKAHHPGVTIVAVDAVGSVIFGQPAEPRLIPGIGASLHPPILAESLVDDVVHVSEPDTVRTCRLLVGRGFLFGGSTGTVVSGAMSWLEKHGGERELCAVAIAPDLGERYLSSIYDDRWIRQAYGDRVLSAQQANCFVPADDARP
jgi:2,3-diaminopropionate biosynthesis protein SbnA